MQSFVKDSKNNDLDKIKQIQETIIIQNFRKHFRGFPKGRLIKSESPDFILKNGPKYSIGIELTTLPIPSYSLNRETIASFKEVLLHSILKKEEKLKLYRNKMADEYWLIVYADSIGAQSKELIENPFEINANSGFERIFLFSLFEGFTCEIINQRTEM